MASRLKLHEELIEVLGSTNVYYQPPESVKMNYDAIIYSKSRMSYRHADDLKYLKHNGYELLVISRNPDNDIADKLMEHFKYISFDRRYIAENLYHDALTLYY